jgi:hypothetical protein
VTTASATATSPQLATPRIRRILALVLAWRVVLLLTFAACAHFLPAQPDEIAFTANHEPQIEAAMRAPGASAVRWDAYYYLHIAAHGYRAEEPRDFAFFPLFPLALAALHRLGLPLISAGLLLNFIATALAAVFLYLLALDYTRDDLKAQRAVLLFLLFPASYFLAAYYAEAVFCALGFAAFYLARRGRWFAANLLLALLTAMRPTALCFALAIAAQYLASERRLRPSVLSFLLAPAGLLVYMAYLQWRFGDALLFARVQHQFWDYRNPTLNPLAPLWRAIRNGAGYAQYGLWLSATRVWLELACCLLVALVLIQAARRMPIGYSVLLGSSLLLFVSTGSLGSIHRFVLPLFPIYLVLAANLSRLRFRAWLATSTALMTFLLAAFVNFRFTG